MTNFEILQKLISHIKCVRCHEYYTADDIVLLREEEESLIIGIRCSHCQLGGIALVTIDRDQTLSEISDFSTEEEEAKFSELPPISTDEVIDFYEFLQNEDIIKLLSEGDIDS